MQQRIHRITVLDDRKMAFHNEPRVSALPTLAKICEVDRPCCQCYGCQEYRLILFVLFRRGI